MLASPSFSQGSQSSGWSEPAALFLVDCLSIGGDILPTRENKRSSDICPDTVLTTALNRRTDGQMVTLKGRQEEKEEW